MEMIEIDPKLFVTCRLCLDNMGVYQIVPSVQQQIKSCYDIEVDPFDGLPQLICKNCESILSKYVEIKNTYINKQRTLREKIQGKSVSFVSKSIESEQGAVSSTQEYANDKEDKKGNSEIMFIDTSSDKSSDTENAMRMKIKNKKYVKSVQKHPSELWEKKYDKFFICRFCDKSCKTRCGIVSHVKTHPSLISKYRKCIKRDCSVKLNKTDNKQNLCNSERIVVHNWDRFVNSSDNFYYTLFRPKQSLDTCNDEVKSLLESKNLSTRDIVSESSDSEPIFKRRCKKKRRRLISKSSSDTVVVEKNNIKDYDKLQTEVNISLESSKAMETNDYESINIYDSSDSVSTKSTNNRETDPNTRSIISSRQADCKAIQNIITVCFKKYLKRQEGNDCEVPAHKTQSPTKKLDSSLEHKVLSFGRKIINNTEISCIGILRYLEHQNLEIVWIPRHQTHSNKKPDHVQIMIKLKNREENEARKCGWTVLREIKYTNPIKNDDILRKENLTADMVVTNKEKSEKTNEFAGAETEQMLSTNSTFSQKHFLLKRLLNANPVQHPKQLPKKTKSSEIHGGVKKLTENRAVLIPLEAKKVQSSEDHLCMPIITSTISLAPITILDDEGKKNNHDNNVAQVTCNTSISLNKPNVNSDKSNNKNECNEDTQQGLVKNAPWIKVKPVSELMSDKALNTMNQQNIQQINIATSQNENIILPYKNSANVVYMTNIDVSQLNNASDSINAVLAPQSSSSEMSTGSNMMASVGYYQPECVLMDSVDMPYTRTDSPFRKNSLDGVPGITVSSPQPIELSSSGVARSIERKENKENQPEYLNLEKFNYEKSDSISNYSDTCSKNTPPRHYTSSDDSFFKEFETSKQFLKGVNQSGDKSQIIQDSLALSECVRSSALFNTSIELADVNYSELSHISGSPCSVAMDRKLLQPASFEHNEEKELLPNQGVILEVANDTGDNTPIILNNFAILECVSVSNISNTPPTKINYGEFNHATGSPCSVVVDSELLKPISLQYNGAENSVPYPGVTLDINNESQLEVSNDSMTVLHRRKPKCTKNVRDKDYCFYCEVFVLNFARHLLRHHIYETEVQRIISKPKKCLERKQLIAALRKKGNYIVNSLEVTKPMRKQKYTDYLPCTECLGFYSKKLLWKHKQKCSGKKDAENIQSEAQNLLIRHLKIDENLFPRMRADKTSLVAKKDSLICAFGSQYLKTHREKHFVNVVSRKMRDLAKLLIEVKKIEPSINDLFAALRSIHYDIIVQATKILAKCNTEKDRYETPAFAMNMSTTLKQCCNIAIMCALKKQGPYMDLETSNLEADLKTLIQLIESNWKYDISTQVATDLNKKKWNKVTIVPLANDLKKLIEYLNKKSLDAAIKIKEGLKNTDTYIQLLETVYCRVLLLNRRRPGELHRITLPDYLESENNDSDKYEEFDRALTASERILVKKFKRVVIRGKRGRGVPVLFSQEVQDDIKLLLSIRNIFFISAPNQFLFGNPGYENTIYGYKVLEKHARLSGAKNPKAISSKRLRKHLATLSQIFSMSENDMEQLATFMGHTNEVHKKSYRLPDDVYQTAKISKLLILMEDGKADAYKGKSLDEIDLDMNEELDEDVLENDQILDYCCEPTLVGSSHFNQQQCNPNDLSQAISFDLQNNFQQVVKEQVLPHGTERKIQKGKKRTLVPWTKAQKDVVTNYFKFHIKNHQPPKRHECEKLKVKHGDLLDNKDWLKIKVFVQNIYSKSKK